MVNEKPVYQKSIVDVIADLKTSQSGLTSAEASERIRQHGLNELKTKQETTAWTILLDQFSNFFTLLLIGASLLSFFVRERIDVGIIAVVVAVNVVVGFVQEYKAQNALKALRKFLVGQVSVIRGGKKQTVVHTELVPGDIVELSSGQKVPADIRLIEVEALKIDEAALTGESTPVIKMVEALKGSVDVPDQKNMAFTGTLVVAGRALGVVVATGSETEFARIAKLVSLKEEASPLEIRLKTIGQWFTIIAVLIAAVVFALAVARGQSLLSTFTFVIALLVAAVPESLPTIVTLSLAIGVVRLAKSQSIVRRLPVVETLGDIDVIATDKTATLTKNEMTTTKIVVITKDTKIIESDVTGVGYTPEGKIVNHEIKSLENFENLIRAAALCNDATAQAGDPTERALYVLAQKSGLSLRPIKRVDEIPFDPKLKFMATLHEDGTVAVKGALEVVLPMCDIASDSAKLLTEKEAELAKQGLRVLALAGLPAQAGVKTKATNLAKKLSKLKLYGLVGMLDPIREGVKEALDTTAKAGIRTIIITGDHKLTAQAIARQLGMTANDEDILEGKAVAQMSDGQLKEVVKHAEIFARALPEVKLKIVEALKSNGSIVAVTGDGVNDAPALKSAHVGIAMGKRGTDVAKETADLVLLDDSFATIVKSVEFGRGIFDNIRKFITLLLAGNLDEIALVALAAVVGWAAPFTTVQLLWINLVTDSFPALALGFQPPAQGILKDKPFERNRGIIRLIFSRSLLLASFGFIAGTILFAKFLPVDVALARTIVFTFMVLYELAIVFPLFRDRPFYQHGQHPTIWLYAAVLLSFFLQLISVYGPFAQFFGTVPLGLVEWLWVGGLVVLGYAFAEGLNLVRGK